MICCLAFATSRQLNLFPEDEDDTRVGVRAHTPMPTLMPMLTHTRMLTRTPMPTHIYADLWPSQGGRDCVHKGNTFQFHFFTVLFVPSVG